MQVRRRAIASPWFSSPLHYSSLWRYFSIVQINLPITVYHPTPKQPILEPYPHVTMSSLPGRTHKEKAPLPPLCLPGRGNPTAPGPQSAPPRPLLCLPGPANAKPQSSLPPLCLPGREATKLAPAPQPRVPQTQPALVPSTPDVAPPIATANPPETEQPELAYPTPALDGQFYYDGKLFSSAPSPLPKPAHEELTHEFVDLLTTSLRAEIARLDQISDTGPSRPPTNTLPSRYPHVYQEYHHTQEQNRRLHPYTKRTPRWAPDEYVPIPLLAMEEPVLDEMPPEPAPPVTTSAPTRRPTTRKPRVRPPKPEDMPTWNVFRCDKPGCIFRDSRCPSLTKHVLQRPDHDPRVVSVSWVGEANQTLPPNFRSGEPVNARFARIRVQKQARIEERTAREAAAQNPQ